MKTAVGFVKPSPQAFRCGKEASSLHRLWPRYYDKENFEMGEKDPPA